MTVATDVVNSGCVSGYSKVISVGIDDGTPSGTARNGILETGEIDSSFSVCTTCPSGFARNAANQCEVDSDGDGTVDAADACPANPALSSLSACGDCVVPADSDGDGLANCVDLDTSLLVTSSINYASAGSMFDIVPSKNMRLKSLRFIFNGCGLPSQAAQVYYKTGTFVGNVTNQSAWTIVTSATVACNNAFDSPYSPFNAEIGLNDLALTANSRYAIYLAGISRDLASNWTGIIGDSYVSDANLNVYVGSPVAGFFGAGYLGAAAAPSVRITYNTY
jgi:hypothetical protein